MTLNQCRPHPVILLNNYWGDLCGQIKATNSICTIVDYSFETNDVGAAIVSMVIDV